MKGHYKNNDPSCIFSEKPIAEFFQKIYALTHYEFNIFWNRCQCDKQPMANDGQPYNKRRLPWKTRTLRMLL